MLSFIKYVKNLTKCGEKSFDNSFFGVPYVPGACVYALSIHTLWLLTLLHNYIRRRAFVAGNVSLWRVCSAKQQTHKCNTWRQIQRSNRISVIARNAVRVLCVSYAFSLPRNTPVARWIFARTLPSTRYDHRTQRTNICGDHCRLNSDESCGSSRFAFTVPR